MGHVVFLVMNLVTHMREDLQRHISHTKFLIKIRHIRRTLAIIADRIFRSGDNEDFLFRRDLL